MTDTMIETSPLSRTEVPARTAADPEKVKDPEVVAAEPVKPNGPVSEQRQRSAGSSDSSGWIARPWAARILRAFVMVFPSLVGALASWIVAALVGRPTGLLAGMAWWSAMLGVGVVTFTVFGQFTRRLLPLATLLRLSLIFPDQTPSRYRVALRAGTTKSLRSVVARAEAGDIGDTPAEAAETVLLLTAALNRHDRLTRGHSERVRAYSEVLGEELGLDADSLSRLRWAALLHDVGKLVVPSEVLNKPGRLTNEEFELIKQHPLEGERLIAPLAEWLGDEGNAVGQHHERFDGGGYPRGLAGTEISLAARIVSVADSFDVITSARSYKKPIPASEARAELVRCTGTQFDPRVTQALLDVSLGRLWRAGGPLTCVISAPVLSKIPMLGSPLSTLGGTAATLGVATVIAAGGATLAGTHPMESTSSAASPTALGAPAAFFSNPAVNGAHEERNGEKVADGGTSGTASNADDPEADNPAHVTGATGENEETTGAKADSVIGAAESPSDPQRTGSDPDTANGSSPTSNGSHNGSGNGGGLVGGTTGAVNNTLGKTTDAVNGLTGSVGGTVNQLVDNLPLPPVSLPPVTIPPVTLPPIKLPPVTIPPLIGGLLGGRR